MSKNQTKRESPPPGGWREEMRYFVRAAIFVLFIRTFGIAAYEIPSSSMEPTLVPGDRIIVWKCAYGFKLPFLDAHLLPWRHPSRKDIVVFQAPHQPHRDFVKRCIGLPGEHVTVDHQAVRVNNDLLQEPYAVFRDKDFPWLEERITAYDSGGPLPDARYFMMGDNRYGSSDSRVWGLLPRGKVRGQALLLVWPLRRFTWLPSFQGAPAKEIAPPPSTP